MPGKRRPLLAGLVLTGLVAALLGSAGSADAVPAKRSVARAASKATASSKRAKTIKPAVQNENWAAPSTRFGTRTDYYPALTEVPVSGATDGQALRLTMPAHPEAGAGGGAVIASSDLYRYGRFGTRMRTVDCAGQDHPGVVTGTFTYAPDHADENHNGITDNAEIDIEILCAQPNVIYLSIWTDYDETGNDFREITRAVDLRTGAVLKNCYLEAWGSPCEPERAGEDSPASVPAIPDFDSATGFHTYAFDWEADHVTFTADDGAGHTEVLWNYRGPKSRIPSLPSALYQNVTYTSVWDPLDGVAHNQPTVPEYADIDSTFTPKPPHP